MPSDADMARLVLRSSVLHRLAFGRQRFEGVAPLDMQVLLALVLRGSELKVTELASDLALPQKTLSHSLRRLSADGLITRRVGKPPSDRPDAIRDDRERWVSA